MHNYKLCFREYANKGNGFRFTLQCPECNCIFDIFDTDKAFVTRSIPCPKCDVPYMKEINQADCMWSLIDRIKDEEVYGI